MSIISLNEENVDDEMEEKLALINALMDKMYISSAVMETTLDATGLLSNRNCINHSKINKTDDSIMDEDQ